MTNDGPAIRPTQFEGDSVGRLAKCVNMSRGDVNLVKSLVSLPGRPGDATLAVNVVAQCESNVFQQAVRWNLDAPTGVLGLGWSLPGNRITLECSGSLTPASVSYTAEIDGVPNALIEDSTAWRRATIDTATANAIIAGTVPAALVASMADQGVAMAPTAVASATADGWSITDAEFEHVLTVVPSANGANVVDGGVSYQLQNYQFWRCTYYQPFERWEVTTDTGEVRVFGGGVSTTSGNVAQSAGNSIAWAVKWGGPDGNDLGPSSATASQVQYARQWNLCSRSDRWGSSVHYGYNEFSRGADGLLGRNVEQPVCVGGLPYTKAVYLTSITDVYGRTITFSYGDKSYTATVQEYADPHKQLEPAAAPETPPANLGQPTAYQDRYETLYLASIVVANEDAAFLYSLNFVYLGPVAVSTLSGPLATTAAKRYLSSITEMNGAGQTMPCYAFEYDTDLTSSPNLGAIASITYPQGAVADVTYGSSDLDVCQRAITIEAPAAAALGATPLVFYGVDYVVSVWASQDQSTITLDVYSWVGYWAHWSPGAPIYQDATVPAVATTIQAVVNDVSFALAFATSAGDTRIVLVARDPNISTLWSVAPEAVTIDGTDTTLTGGSNFVVATIDQLLYVFTWNWMSGTWSGTNAPRATFPNPVVAIAQNEFYVTATADSASTTIAISWVDTLGQWHSGSEVSVASTPGFNTDQAILWDVNASALAMTFAEDPNGFSYTVELVTWGTDYTLAAQAFGSLPGEAIDVGNIVWPPPPVVSTPCFVGVRQNVFRYDGGTWTLQSFATVAGAGPGSWLAFAYGSDIAVQVENTGSDALTTVLSYDPTNGQFQSFPVSTALPSGADVALLGWPSVAGDYLIARNALFFRGASTDWSSAVATPVASLPAVSDGQPVDSQSFVNGGDYLAYLSTDPDPSQNAVQLLVLQNGSVLEPGPAALPATSYTVPASPWSGFASGQAPIGPGSFVTYPANTEGFGATQSFQLYRYAGDALSGPITTYPVQSIAIGDGFGATYPTAYEFDGATAACDPTGQVVKYFRSASYSGAPDPTSSPFGRTVFSYQNGYATGSDFSMLDGLLIQTAAFWGSMLFTTLWQSSFALADDPTPQAVSPGLQAAFTAAGVPLAAAAVISWVQIDGVYAFWSVIDAEATYAIDYTGSATDPAGVRVFAGGPSQSVTTTWDVFTSRAGAQLHGGYARPTQTVARTDGVPTKTSYTYADFNGSVLTKTWTLYNGVGIEETHVEETVYGTTQYPALTTANLLSPVVALRQTTTIDGVTSTSSSSATTWTGWRQGSGAGLLVQAPWQSWSWIGDPTGGDQGEFPFADAPESSLWNLTSTVTQRNDQGLALESNDASGVRHSTLYDALGQVPIASLSNGSFEEGQALYAGFESYEELGRWELTGGAAIATTAAHTGSSCLSLPAGAAVAVTTLTPSADRPAIFSAWVCTSDDFTAGPDSGWTVTLQSGAVVTMPIEPTANAWCFQSVAVPAATSVSIAATNVAGTVLLDDVTFVPLTAEFSARVYDAEFRLPTARLDECGHTWRTYRDAFMREIGGSDATDTPCALELKYFSAAANPSGFSADDPNAAIAVKAFLAGSYQDPDDWVIQPTGAVSVAPGRLVHVAAAPAATLASALPASADFALYFETLPLDAGPLALTDVFSVSAGSTTFTLSAASGRWDVGGNDFVGPLQSCLVVQTGGWLMFWANGTLISSVASTDSVQPSIATGANAVAIANLTLLVSPALRVKYSDATGAERQDHLVTAEGYLVHQTIQDARAQVIATTKPAPGLFGTGADLTVPAYRPGFVDVASFLATIDASATMAGDVADWYDGVNDTDDAGYPYTRTVYEPSPLARPLERGFPGAAYAIVDFATSPPASRATPQFRYGSNTAPTPYLDLPADAYGVSTQIIQSKVETMTVTDATSIGIGRYTANANTTFLSANNTDFGNGVQSLTIQQPNAFALGESGAVETQTHNALQQLTVESSPDSGTSRYIYDDGGRIRFTQDASAAADGVVVYFCWDGLGRMTSRGVVEYDWPVNGSSQLQQLANDGAWPENQLTVPYTQQREWSWDGDGTDPAAVGHLVQLRAVTGSTTVSEDLTWDAAGRLAARSVSVDATGGPSASYTTEFGYDLQGRLTAVTYPSSPGIDVASIGYTYDGQDNVIAVTDDQGQPFVEYTYNAIGEPATVTYAGGLIDGTFNYDSPGRSTATDLTWANGSFQFTLGYDVDGMVSSLSETLAPVVPAFDATVQYGYDPLGRLVSAVDAQGGRSLAVSFVTESGVVDQNGNIQSIDDGNGQLLLDYTAGTNQVQAQTAAAVTSSYAYYPNGALRQRGTDLGITYVAGTMLPSVVTTPLGATSFAYDARGERAVSATGADAWTLNVNAGFAGPIVTVDANGVARALVYGPRGVVAMATSSSRYAVLSDFLRTPRVVVDGSGTVVAAYAYNAFGARTASVEPVAGFLPVGFTGQQLDLESGLYNFRARLYDPTTGRFLAPDPASQFPSAYCYAGNLPTLLIDANGQMGALGEALLDTTFALILVAAIVATSGAAAALVPLAAAEGGALAAIGAGAAIGAVGGAVSNAAFQGLYYDVTTPPGDWDAGDFGKTIGAAAIGGAVGGALTGGLSPMFAPAAGAAEDLSNFTVTLTDDDLPGCGSSAERPAEEPSVPERAPQPDPAAAPAQRSWTWKELAAPALREGAIGAVGGSVRGYVQAGMTNVFDGRGFNDDVVLFTLRNAASGFAFGALGGAFAAANEASQYTTRALASIKSAFSDEPLWFVVAGLATPIILTTTTGAFLARTASMTPTTHTTTTTDSQHS